jgi:hypothetical protein
MTVWYSQELTGYFNSPVIKPNAVQYGGNLVCYDAQIIIQSQQIGDTVIYGVIPTGCMFRFGLLLTDTSLGASTISLGTAAFPAQYRAAGPLTSANTDVPFNTPPSFVTGAVTTPLKTQEIDILTIAASGFPLSGNLFIRTVWAHAGS